MTQIQFPDMRENLIVAIKYLANSAEEPVIVHEEGGKIKDFFNFKMAIHQIFDDLPFLEDVYSAVGVYLNNKSEAYIMTELLRKLEKIVEKDCPDSTKDWLDMVETAKIAEVVFGR